MDIMQQRKVEKEFPKKYSPLKKLYDHSHFENYEVKKRF